MNRFFQQVFLGNTVQEYLITFGVIAAILLLNKNISRFIARAVSRLFRRQWKHANQLKFVALVVHPLSLFLTATITIIALYRLTFPDVLNVGIYKYSLKVILHTIGIVIQIVLFIWLLLRMIDFIAIILHIRADQTEDPTDNQLIVFFKDFFKVVLVLIGILMIVKFAFGFNISNLLTGLSLVGAAIALALRESLENLIASFIIFFDRPFRLGDIVKVHTFTGTVEKIGLRSTRIRTDQKTYITVPNKQMVDSILDNLSLRTQRKGELRLDIGLTTSSAELDQFIINIRKILDRPDIESSTVLLNDITHSAFQILIDYFTGPVTQKEFNAVKEQVNFQVLKLMESMKLEIAGTSTDVKIINSKTEN